MPKQFQLLAALLVCGILCTIAIFLIPGCTDDGEVDHPHIEGEFGGIIVPVGRDHYHAEVLFVAGGQMRIYMRGKDEVKVVDIEEQTLKAFVRAKGVTEAVEIELQPDTQPGDKPGRTSQFSGQLPADFATRQMLVTVPQITVNGERYRFHFMTEEPDAEHPSMPAKVTDSAEKELYLTPAGAYTAADVKANGSQTASSRYADFQSKHNLHPQPGDRLCPVTKTRASNECTWIIAGKTYFFCCPPCIDEFVKQARENPAQLQPPESFIKKADPEDSTAAFRK
jgi:YHS domain-containing protein